MSRRVFTVAEDTPLADVVRRMDHHRVKRFPVVTDDRVVGIVSRANLLRALAGLLHQMSAEPEDDGKIREAFYTELARQPWAPHTSINPVVRNGVIELWGNIFDERERSALRVMASSLAGVREVRDHLVWIDPSSGFVGDADTDKKTQRL